MMQNLPDYISIIFLITVALTFLWFYLATRSKAFLFLSVIWIGVQTLLGLNGFFQDTTTLPPKILVIGVLPALIAIVITFATKKGRAFIDRVNLKTLTYFHSIRIPVEIVLFLLFQQSVVSILMTFEGTNFDLFSGITAPIVGYFAFRKGTVNRKLLLGWNILCLGLLVNVVVTAILVAPFPFQVLSLNQPNIAVLYYPFNLLPTYVVPLVLFAHLIALRQLRRKK